MEALKTMGLVYIIVLLVLFISLVLTIIRAGLGPTWFDRMIALNSFTTKIILVIAVYLFATGHPEFIDIALLYGLINYVGTLAVINYFKRQSESNETETGESA